MASSEDEVVLRLKLKDVARFIADVKSGRLAIDDLEKKISKAGRTAAKESSESGGFGKLVSHFGFLKYAALGAVGSLAAAGGGVVAYAIKSTASLEQVQVAFTTLLHSSRAASLMVANLQKFAVATPFELSGVEESTQKLLAFGFSARSIIPTLTAIGNAASGLNLGQGGMDEIITALGQMRMKGRVQGDELLQLAEHGVNAYQFLQKGLHLTPDQLQKAVQKGKISAATAIPIILKQMNQQFKGLMDKESHTLGGIWSNLHDAIQQGLIRLASPYLPAMKKWLQDLVDRMPQIEAFLSTVITRTISGVKTAVDIGRQVFTWGRNAATQAADWAKTLIGLIQGAVASGDWTPVGAALGASIRDALMKVGGMLGNAGSAAGGVDWFDVGKKAASGAVGFVLGFVIALFNPTTWGPVLQKHWLEILIAIVTALPLGKGLGLIAKVLEKIPILKMLAPLFSRAGGALEAVGGPVWKFISAIGRAIGRAFIKVWPDLGANLRTWFTQIGEFFAKDVPGLKDKVLKWVAGLVPRAIEGMFTAVFRVIDKITKPLRALAGRLWKPIADGFKAVIGWIVDHWNSFFGWLQGLPIVGGVFGSAANNSQGSSGGTIGDPSAADSGVVPGLARGGRVTSSGYTRVGERGPELLNLPRGSRVIPLPRGGNIPAMGGDIHVHVDVDGRELAHVVHRAQDSMVARR